MVQTALCYSNPGSHPFISTEEREYLEKELGQLKRHKNLPPTPWVSILTSVPMIALVCAQVRKVDNFSNKRSFYTHFFLSFENKTFLFYATKISIFFIDHLTNVKHSQIGHDWGFYIMVSDLPKYMSEVLQFSIKDNGIYSSLPYLVMWIVSVSTGWLSDFLIVRNFFTITGARKWFTGIGKHLVCDSQSVNTSSCLICLVFHLQLPLSLPSSSFWLPTLDAINCWSSSGSH